MKRLLRRLHVYPAFLYKTVVYLLKRPRTTAFLHKNVPYFSQWESPELVDKIVHKKISAKDDPVWKASGAKTKEEYLLWSWNSCGMACLKAILAKEKKKEYPIVTLGKKCMTYGGYKPSQKKGDLAGLYYEPFIRFIKQEFGLRGEARTPLILNEIIFELSKGNYVLASVHPWIRTPKNHPPTRNGHLVLLLGYDLAKKLVYLHNPSGNTTKTQSYAKISFADFAKFFGGRGMVIHK